MKIAVVGLGIAGLSICARLAEAGHDVSGFEQFEPMHMRGSSHGDTRIFRLTPGEGDIYVRLAERAHAGWLEWEIENGAPLMQQADGLMAGPAGSAFVASCARLGKEYNRQFTLMRGDAVEAFTRGALRLPADWDVCGQSDCAVLFADAARAFLLKRAVSAGAKLHQSQAIAAPIESTTLVINGDTHAFGAIIVAAGGWARKLLPEFRDRLTVKRRAVGWFAPRPPLPRPAPLLCADNDVGLYGMPTPDGRYKIGLHVVGDEVDPDRVAPPSAEDAAQLSAQISAHFPLLDPAPTALKTCLYTITPDENFLIAPSQAHPRVLLFSCCSGHGFKYAPTYGSIALAWLEGRETRELAAFNATRGLAATGLGRRQQDAHEI